MAGLARARSQRGRSASFPAPTRGWVSSKNIADMRPDEALDLLNYIPFADRVELRGGSSSFATMAAAQSTLFSYQSGSAGRLLSAGDGKVFNVSAGGDLTAAVALASGYTNNTWQSVNFGTAGGQFLIAVNGSDTGWSYNGTTVSALSISGGSTVADYIHVHAHARRLFFVVKNSLNFDYLSVETIGGTASTVDLAAYCKRGGFLMAMGSWTVDAGDGVNDYAVFVTSEGEVLVFQGTNPGDAANWSMVGIFQTAAPIARRCLVNTGAELLILTREGPRALTALFRGDGEVERLNNIDPSFKAAAASFGSNSGWQMLAYPANKLLIANVPVTASGSYEQYVFQQESGGWCRFSGWNTPHFVVHNQNLYFCGTDSRIYQALSGNDDNGTAISGDIKIAFNYLGNRNTGKQVTSVRPVWQSSAELNYGLEVNTDFDNQRPNYSLTIASGGTPWGSLTWSSWVWGNQSLNVQQFWEKAGGIGRCFSLWLRTQTRGFAPALYAVDWVWEEGGIF